MPQPSSTRQVSSTGLSRRCCLRASPDRPTRLRLAVPKWTRRQGEETPLGPSSGEETPISQDGMSYRVRSLPSSLFHPSNRALPSDCVARVEKLTPWPFQVSGPAQGEVPPFVPQPSSTRQVSSTGLSRRCCLRASPDRPTRLRLAVPKWTRRQGEETPLGPSSGEETPISQDGMSYRVRSLPSSLFHPSNRALPSDCVARVEKLTPLPRLI